MVHQVGSFEAKTRLAELLSLAERGDEIVVMRRGQRIAVIMGARRYDEVSKPSEQDWRERLRAWVARADRPRLTREELDELRAASRKGLP
jgi:prevent-host-death family protein